MDTILQGHRDQALDNDCTSKAVEAVDYNEVGKRAVEDAAAIAIAEVMSSVLEPQLQL